MKKRALEILLSSVEAPENPSASMEQYPTPSGIAADILYFAYSMGDIEGKRIADLGCGGGIFSIGAALLGAESVVGVDADENSLKKARKNIGRFPDLSSYMDGKRLQFLEMDVSEFRLQVDTVLMNPPFGSQKRGADRPFLEAAINNAGTVYSLHNAATEEFVTKKAWEMGAEVTAMKNYKFPIPFMFKFHRKERTEIDVTMFRMERMSVLD